MILVLTVFLVHPAISDCYASSPFKTGPSQETTSPKTGWTAGTIRWLNQKQLELRNELSGQTRQFKKEKQFAVIGTLIAFSFLYGLLHALGPGHGKNIVMSYMLADENPSVFKGAAIGSTIALVETLSALIIVYGIYFTSVSRIKPAFDASARNIQQASYLLLFCLGLILLAFRLKKHLHVKRSPKRNSKKTDQPKKERGTIVVALSLGVIPCPGVMILLVFMLAMQLPVLGAVLALFMACGMAITISLFGGIVAFAKPRIVGSLARNHKLMHSIEAFLEIVGAVLIVVFSGLFLLSI